MNYFERVRLLKRISFLFSKGLLQRQIAERCGVSQQVVAYWRGKMRNDFLRGEK